MTYHFLKTAIEGVAVGGVVALNGDKTDGVEAIVKELRKRFDDVEVFSKAHGKLAWFTRPDVLPDLSDWDAKPFEIDGGFTSFPGIFSSDRPDKGSELLLTHLPALKGRVADLGAGWGYLARHILSFDAVSGLDMVEADFHACEMARINVTDTRATHHWADVLTFEGKSFDTVVMNPPFHTSRKPDPALGQAFIRKAAEILSPRGSLWMVANRNLPYEAVLEESFQVITTVAQTGGFKVVHAERPQNSRKTR
jgi:16S rRNA (guanine1207-N2)-methyltransferase